jgi:hypothetical protein
MMLTQLLELLGLSAPAEEPLHVGKIYVMQGRNPWKNDTIYAEIIELKGGWVRYKRHFRIGAPQFDEAEEIFFRTCYKKCISIEMHEMAEILA